MVSAWKEALTRATHQAVEMGHLQADTDCDQLVYEMRALIFALHHDARFLQANDAIERTERAFRRLIANHTVPPLAHAA
jgi:hypothetical protein